MSNESTPGAEVPAPPKADTLGAAAMLLLIAAVYCKAIDVLGFYNASALLLGGLAAIFAVIAAAVQFAPRGGSRR